MAEILRKESEQEDRERSQNFLCLFWRQAEREREGEREKGW